MGSWVQQRAAIVGGYDDPAGLVLVGGGELLFYQTNFPTAENPLSENGIWRQLDTPNETVCQIISSGKCGGTMAGGGFDDSQMWIPSFQQNNYKVSAVVGKNITSGDNNQEVEILVGYRDDYTLRDTVTFGFTRCNGYEVNIHWNGAYCNIGRFKGAAISNPSTVPVPADGDLFEVTYTVSSGNPTIAMFWNGSAIGLTTGGTSITDTDPLKISSGGPGIGFFYHAGASPGEFFFKSVTVTKI